MVSDDLRSLKVRLQSFERTGLTITPAALRAICAILDTAIKDVEGMVANTIKQPCIKVLPPRNMDSKVVNFSELKAQNDIREWISGQGVQVITDDTDGGDAA